MGPLNTLALQSLELLAFGWRQGRSRMDNIGSCKSGTCESNGIQVHSHGNDSPLWASASRTKVPMPTITRPCNEWRPIFLERWRSKSNHGWEVFWSFFVPETLLAHLWNNHPTLLNYSWKISGSSLVNAYQGQVVWILLTLWISLLHLLLLYFICKSFPFSRFFSNRLVTMLFPHSLPIQCVSISHN